MITLIPHAGLCNRMRAIESSIALSKALNHKLVIYWVKNSGINCGFHDLFDPFPPSVATVKDLEKKPFHLIDCRNKNKVIKFPIELLQKILFDKIIFVEDFNRQGSSNFNFNQFKKYDKILLESQTLFYNPQPHFMYQDFNPKIEIQEKVKSITSRFTEDTVGVHIRRTDNYKAIKNSPLELFIHVMRKEIELNHKTHFFVASDDESVKTRLLSLFGDRVILSSEHKADRSTKSGMVNALTDLYILSNTKKIFGSHWSSFSHTASHISGIKEIVVRKENLPEVYR